LKLFTALTVAGTIGAAAVAMAQTATEPVVVPGEGTPPDLNAYQIQQVKVTYQKLLLKEKDIPNAITHVNAREIQAQGQMGSIQSVLRQAPSVFEYQSGPGQGVPVITIRGVRGAEIADTIDGTPSSDILFGGTGSFLSNNIGSPITLGETSGATVYPGVAPPPDQGFGSGGGTVAYDTINPDVKRSAEIFGSYGSFNTSDAGFKLNSGSLNGEADGARVVLRYDQAYTNGFIDDTNERSQNMIFKAVKPYDGGLSNFTATVIYNRGFGYVNTAPLPLDLISKYSRSYNFAKSTTFSSQDNTYLTAILSDSTYINEHLIVGGSLFEIHNAGSFLSYEDPKTIPYNPAFPYQYTFQVPYLPYGPFGATAIKKGLAGNNPVGVDPFSSAPPGSDPTQPYSYVYGEDAELNQSHENTVGFQPKINVFLPYNNISLGGLVSKTSSSSISYFGSSPNVPTTIANSFGYGGGDQRTVYQAYIQDKIDFHNLHLQPGVTIASAYSSNITQFALYSAPSKVQNFQAVAEPYFGASYDFPYHLTGYASYGKGAFFAPLTAYEPLQDANGNVIGSQSPRPEIIHLYEAGLRYDTSRVYINIDRYYQKISDADSFFVNYQTGQFLYGNDGNQQFRGWEAATTFVVTPSLSLFGNAAYNESTYLNNYFAQDTTFEDQYGYVFKGDPLASAPNWLANFGLDFHHGDLAFLGDNFAARISEEYTGSQYITYDFPPQLTYTGPNITNNPLCSEGGVPHVPNACLNLATVPDYKNPLKELISGILVPAIKQPAFLVSNLLLTYDLPVRDSRIQKLHFELNIQNFANIHYLSHLYSSYAEIPASQGGFVNSSAYESGFYGPPRSFTLEVSAKF
jgi:iron complex outermembrane receptor protein